MRICIFEKVLILTYDARIPPLAQLVRARSLYLRGPWFESKGADKLEEDLTRVQGGGLLTLTR